MMKKWMAMVLLAAMLVGLLAGCGQKEASEAFKASVDAIAEVYLALDEQAGVYAEALTAAEAYLAGDSTQEETMEALEAAHGWFQREYDTLEAPEADDGLMQSFEDCGVSLQDYQAFGEELAYSLNVFLFRTGNLMEYLSYAEEFKHYREQLADACQNGRRWQADMAGYYFYAGVNSWFLEPSASEMAYLQETLIDEIRHYIPEEIDYKTTMEALQGEVDRYLDGVEALNREMEAKTGQYENELREMYQALGKLTDFLAQIQNMNMAQEPLRSIGPRLGEITEEMTAALYDGDMEKIRQLSAELDEIIAAVEDS